MHIHLMIGPSERATARLRRVLTEKAGTLARHGFVAPSWNPIRLYLACSDPGRPGAVRHARGYRTAGAQARLRAELEAQLDAVAATAAAGTTLVLACGQLGRLMPGRDELACLKRLLSPVASGITVSVHLDEPARHLARAYAERVADGRTAPLSQEFALAASGAPWWPAACAMGGVAEPALGLFPTLQAPPHWLDYEALLAHWEAVFGAGSVHPYPLDLDRLAGTGAAEVLAEALGLDATLGPMPIRATRPPPNAPTTARIRAFNAVLIAYAAHSGRHCPRDLRRRFVRGLAIDGPPIAPGALSAVSKRFRAANARLVARFPALAPALVPDPPRPDWQEADPGFGFRATQYMAAFRPAFDRHAVPVSDLREADRAEDAAHAAAHADGALTAAPGGWPVPATCGDAPDAGQGVPQDRPAARVPASGATPHAPALPPLALMHAAKLRRSAFAPHNRLGEIDEESPGPPFPVVAPPPQAADAPRRVIVACMKNEAPYLLEWVAYHRAIGIDGFLIYSNGCEDGTGALLDRLAATGVVQHRRNDDWTGNSPQQHALTRALDEDIVREAEWLAHIDVDEFINVRCGDGTLDALLDRVPEATNVAMTWRLFGHNGVHSLEDRFVIAQFDTCAPRYCPKPHTAWGYKTLFRNIGAYGKLSCHRPNKLRAGFENRVRWVNGSGADITREALRRGWRSSRTSIGYDLVQLNHYALRSAESFLVKRQRGRALHVDRAIGLGYWIRMDWSDARDVTIQRNLPRLQAEHGRLLEDRTLARQHAEGVEWHRAKARALRARPDFDALFRQAVGLRLNGTDRAAYALALDVES